MTKPTGVYLQLPTLRRLAPHLTNLVGLDSLINRLADAAGYGAADAYPVATTRDAQAALVAAHGYDARYDLNGDMTVNVGDQGLSAALGMPQSAPVQPPSSVLDTIIHDITAPHDGVPCGIAGFDWEHAAKVQGEFSASWPQAVGWGWASRLCGSDQNSNPRVDVIRVGTWLKKASSPTYTKIQGSAPWSWHETYTTDTNHADPTTDPTWRTEPDGSNSFVVPRDRALHYAGDNPGIPVASDWRILVVTRARLHTPTPGAKMLVCTGADWWKPGQNRAGGVGRIKLLPTDGSWITGTYTSIPASELAAHPPPV